MEIKRWQWDGFFFTGMVGTLLHFLYDWSKGAALLGIFSAVNESTWEHMKILFVPMFLFALWQSTVFAGRYHNFWCAKLLGIGTGLLLIPTLYYTYTGALGIHVSWLNILIFYLADAAVYLLETHLLLRQKQGKTFASFVAMLVVWGIAFAFLVFTYFPPHLPLFQDPITQTYGLLAQS